MKKKYLLLVFTAIIFSASASAQVKIITTIAGGGGLTTDGIPATAAYFDLPYSIAIDGAGNIFVSDHFAAVVKKINTAGIISTYAGNYTIGYSGDGGPATAASLGSARGIALDVAGNLYIADDGNNIIRKVNTSGIITTFAGTVGVYGYSGDGGPATAAKFYYPLFVTVDGSGNVFVTDNNNHAVRKINTAGIISTVAGNGTPGFSGDGGSATSASLNSPQRIVKDAAGNLFIADATNHRIRKVNTSGIISTIAGNGSSIFSGDGGAATSASLASAWHVGVDGLGNIYITDQNRIRKVNTSGIISTIVGTSTSGFSGDGGLATLAKLNAPAGVAVDVAGNLYVADAGNARVRLIKTNSTPRYTGGSLLSLSVCQNSAGDSLNTLLPVIDSDVMQTLTWSLGFTAPSHGIVGLSGISSSNGSTVIPVGKYYKPTPGYIGPDIFSVQISDGYATSMTTVNVTVSSCSTAPIANFIPSSTSIAPGVPITTTNTSTGSPTPTYLWSVTPTTGVTFTPSTTATNPSVTFATAGTYTVTLTATNSSGTNSHNAVINVTSGPTITLTSITEVDPWQRAGESYTLKLTATTSDASTWRIVAHDPSSANPDQFSTYHSSGTLTTWTPTFASITPTIQYYVQSLTGAIQNLGTLYQTEIIEHKWVQENVVYHNIPTKQLNLPLKNIPGTTSVTCNIYRLSGVSTASITDEIVSTSFLVLGGSNKYIQVNYSNSNIQNVSPGVFTYHITYAGTGYSESGAFDLTKIGQLNTASTSNKIIIFVAGIFNTTEADFNTLRLDLVGTALPSSTTPFSLASNLSLSGYDCWYIAQSNANLVTRNAYDVGIALQEISKLKPSASEINFVCHSKGGLEIRALLAAPPLISQSFAGYSFDFNNFQTTHGNLVKKVLFLDVPHRGAKIESISNAILTLAGILDGWGAIDINSLLTYPGVQDLLYHNRIVDLINSKNLFVSSPYINYANVTGYSSSFYLNDGVVDLTESTLGFTPSSLTDIRSHFGGPTFIKQMYQNDTRFNPRDRIILHTAVHTNNILHNPGGTSLLGLNNYTSINCNTGTNNLSKILQFFNGTYITSCYEYFIVDDMTGIITASVLSNAAIFYKTIGDSTFQIVDKSDENGKISFRKFGEIYIGDSLMITAPGKESLVFPVDSTIIKTHVFNVGMIPSLAPSSYVQYPSLQLMNQSSITSHNTANLRAAGQNVISYQINSPRNQDSLFIPLTLSSGIFTSGLDTGINRIFVRFIGMSDTVTLLREVYYYPDTLLNRNTYKVTIFCDSPSLGVNLYANNKFAKTINSVHDTIPVFVGLNTLQFTKYGYIDSIIKIDSTSAINVALHLIPNSYSSPVDSNIVDFTTGGKIQYRKNVTVMDTSLHSIISIKQYDDSLGFAAMGLKPKCRKFEMRHINTNWSNIKFVTVLDQIKNSSTDSIYLLKISNSSIYNKIVFDTSAHVAAFDSAVQKLSYNYVNFDSGTVTKEALVIVKKQAPIVRSVSTVNINENATLVLPVATFFSDPDSIHNDMVYNFAGATPTGLSLSILNDSVIIHTNHCYSGNTSFTIKATHDWLIRSNTINVHVISNAGTITGLNNLCVGSTTILSNTKSGGSWSSNDTSILEINNIGVITAHAKGIANISYKRTSGGCTDIATKTVTVNGTAGPITGPTALCLTQTIQLYDTEPGGSWGSDNNTIILPSSSGQMIATGPGVANITHTVTNACGVSSANYSLTVYPDENCITMVNGVSSTPNLKIYPNPNDGVFTVTVLSNTNENVNITITNLLGQKVNELSTKANILNHIKLGVPTGVYLLSATCITNTYFERIIVE